MRRLALAVCLLLPLTPTMSNADPLPQDRSFTVVAVVDGGINPYHADFRRPELTADPTTYISGFPGARRLDLSLDAPTYNDAIASDLPKLKGVADGELVWIPGTNIIARGGRLKCVDIYPLVPPVLPPPASYYVDCAYDTRNPDPDGIRSTLDIGHGTASASLAAGSIHGPAVDSVIVVSIKGSFPEGLQWAARQPWIDIITNSWGTLGGAAGYDKRHESEIVASTYEAARSGKIVCFASGNTSDPSALWSPTTGPSWVTTVGAAAPTTRGEGYFTSWPNTILGLSPVVSADEKSMTGEKTAGGTSAASPYACGKIAKVLASVRGSMGDRNEGPHGGGLAVGIGQGAFADGVLNRIELLDAVLATAVPVSPMGAGIDPASGGTPTLPGIPLAGVVRDGYGIVDETTSVRALNVILGTELRPDRTIEDAWFAATNQVRDAIWGDAPH